MSRRVLVMVLGLSVVFSLGSSRTLGARTPLVAPAMAPTFSLDRALWASSIASARLRSPLTFARVGVVRANLAALDATKRGPLAPIPAHLHGLSRDAIEALAEQLLAPIDATLTESAQTAWHAGLLETLGGLREPRVREVFAAFLDDSNQVVARAAAEATAKLGDDVAVATLVPRIAAQQLAVIHGAGACRRRPIASALAAVVASRPSREVARATARALGELGGSWASRTSKLPAPAEQSDARSIATRALIELFIGYDGDVRQASSNALMMIDDPATPALIASAKSGASSDTIAALDALSVRFAKNPAR